jgi:hypothetical protein
MRARFFRRDASARVHVVFPESEGAPGPVFGSGPQAGAEAVPGGLMLAADAGHARIRRVAPQEHAAAGCARFRCFPGRRGMRRLCPIIRLFIVAMRPGRGGRCCLAASGAFVFADSYIQKEIW